MKTICVFYDINKRKINLEIEIKIEENYLIVSCDDKLDFYYCPIEHETGIYLEKISFPFYLPKNNKNVLLPWYYNKLNLKKVFKNFLLDEILKFCNHYKLTIFLEDSKLEMKIKNEYDKMLKKIIDNKFENLENLIYCYKNIGIYFNYLVKKNLIDIECNKFYCGHNSSNPNEGYLYDKDLYLKVLNSKDKYYPKNASKNVYNFYYLKNQDFTETLVRYILNENLINNLRTLLLNLEETGLYFKFVLFIASNNFKILKKDDGIYNNILNVINELKDTKLILDLNKIEVHQINNLCSFLNKYPIFIEEFLKRIIKQVNFSLNYFKRNLEINFLKFCLIYFGINELKDLNITNLVNFKIKSQMMFLINEISLFRKYGKIKFLNNEKFYEDSNYRLVIKYFIFDNNCQIRNPLFFNDTILKDIQKYSFYREYFYNMSWGDIMKNFNLFKMMVEDRNILIYQNKLNNVIFGRQNFKSIPFILNYKFYLISLLPEKKDIEEFLFFNLNSVNEIFNTNLKISLSSYQIKQIANILYLLKFVENLDLENENYLNFIICCQKIKDILIINNSFTLKIKEMGFSSQLNLGIITKNILKFKSNKKTEDPISLLNKYKLAYYHYRKKYTKYKTKYYLQKFKDNKLYHLKNLKN